MITESVGVMTGDVVIVGMEIGMLMIGDDKLNQSILSLYRFHMIANNSILQHYFSRLEMMKLCIKPSTHPNISQTGTFFEISKCQESNPSKTH